MKLKIDFHMHTINSKDGIMQPEELLKYSKQAGLDVICVTDHNTIKGALDVRKLAKRFGIAVVVGQEVRTRNGEVLVYGVEKNIEPGRPLKETCKEAKRLGGYIVAPHPYDKLRSGADPKRILEFLDAVEVFNSRSLFNHFNRKAFVFASKHGLPMVAGSDAHSKYTVGNAINIIDAQSNARSIFSAIKKKNPIMITKKFSIPFYILYQIERLWIKGIKHR